MDNGASITKADLNTAISAAVKELKDYVDQRTGEIKNYVDQRTGEIKEYVDERTHDAETRLLRAFGDYQEAQTVRRT